VAGIDDIGFDHIVHLMFLNLVGGMEKTIGRRFGQRFGLSVRQRTLGDGAGMAVSLAMQHPERSGIAAIYRRPKNDMTAMTITTSPTM
jgi:hypothetical protein